MKVIALLCLMALFSQGFAQEVDAEEVDAQTWGRKSRTAWDIIRNNPDLSTLAQAIQANGLVGVLNDPRNPVTVWAPNNAAFAAFLATLPPGTNLTNPAVVQILLAHVARGEIKVVGNRVFGKNRGNDITTLNGVITLVGRNRNQASTQGGSITLRLRYSWRDGQGRIVNTISVTKAKDGVVYVATGVLLPRNAFPSLAALTAFYNYTTVRDLIVSNGLLATAENPAIPKTVFGPTNQAFLDIADILATLNSTQIAAALTYHVSLGNLYTTPWGNIADIPTALAGQTLDLVAPNRISAAGFAPGQLATVVLNNIYFPGGIFQGIDTVLIPVL